MSIENHSKKQQTIISRREFTKRFSILGAAAASGLLTTAFVPYDESEPREALSLRKPISPSAPPVEQLPVEQIVPENVFEELFVNCTPEEIISAKNRMNQQVLHYENNTGLATRIKESLKWKDLIYQCAGKLNLSHDFFIVSSLTGLIFVESEGDSQAINRGSGARGLCQLTWESAKAIYDKIPAEERDRLGFSLTKPDDLFDIKTNIILAIKILLELWRTLPDPSLTFWAFHFGQGNVYGAINLYLAGKEKTDEKESINSVTKYQLNFIKLIKDPAVRAGLKLHDDTEFYVPRIAAAKYLLK